MTRRKVNLAYIRNDAERKASYKKRKAGLIKKISELSTLCDVDACAIIYSQYDPEPEVWPSLMEAQAIIARFRKLSEMDQSRKMVDQDSYIRQRTKKAADQLARLQKENKLRELECYMYQCIAGTKTLDDTHLADAADMNRVINNALRNIQARQNALRAGSRPLPHQPPSLPLPEDVVPLPPTEEENLDSFPYNMVQSPAGGDTATGLEDGDFGWDSTMGYPYIFNPSTSNQQGNDQGNSSNNSNYFNSFNN